MKKLVLLFCWALVSSVSNSYAYATSVEMPIYSAQTQNWYSDSNELLTTDGRLELEAYGNLKYTLFNKHSDIPVDMGESSISRKVEKHIKVKPGKYYLRIERGDWFVPDCNPRSVLSASSGASVEVSLNWMHSTQFVRSDLVPIAGGRARIEISGHNAAYEIVSQDGNVVVDAGNISCFFKNRSLQKSIVLNPGNYYVRLFRYKLCEQDIASYAKASLH